MSKLLVSFATRPGHGSEPGVGWAFVKAAANYAASHDERVHIVFDSRDEGAVRNGLAEIKVSPLVVLHAVPLPAWAARRYGNSGSRGSYLAWLPRARREVCKICGGGSVDVVHQVTFATATLPAALPRWRVVKRVWGPLAVPSGVVYARGSQPSLLGRLAVLLSKGVGRLNVKRADVVIATNELTSAALRSKSREVHVEPNIAVDVSPSITPQDDLLLSIVGLLIDRKRPWLAVEALTYPGLGNYHLQVIGDGPLRGELESLVEVLDLSDRVNFLGRLGHAQAIAALGRSRLLLHPAAREGAAWVVGEAAALGIPAVVFDSAGAATTVKLSANGGEVVHSVGNLADDFADGVLRALERPRPTPVTRWKSERFVQLLDEWWSE